MPQFFHSSSAHAAKTAPIIEKPPERVRAAGGGGRELTILPSHGLSPPERMPVRTHFRYTR
eukprot:2369333-Rhodomonas_salina.2